MGNKLFPVGLLLEDASYQDIYKFALSANVSTKLLTGDYLCQDNQLNDLVPDVQH